ncbi:MAG: Yip1 family protein [Candidatus Firestonebacteria bacterium]
MKIDVKSEILKAVEIIKLNKEAIKEVYERKESNLPALLIVLICGLIPGVFRLSVLGIIIGPLLALIGTGIYTAIIFILALIFGGKGSYSKLFRVIGYACMLGWLGFIPFVGWLLCLWILVVTFIALQTNFNMSKVKAGLVVCIPVVIWIIIFLVAMAAVLLFKNFNKFLPMAAKLGGSCKTDEKKTDTTKEQIGGYKELAEVIKKAAEISEKNFKIPDDIPIYKNSEAGTVFFYEDGGTAEFSSSDNVGKVKEFYMKALKEKGWKIVESMKVENLNMYSVSAEKGNDDLEIKISNLEEGKNKTYISISLSKKDKK